ncbi:MAG: site-2 protease family protein [Minisyncoccota bacterium]
MQIDFIFQIAILIMSVVIHEVSHGYMANYLGDPTARLEGRLSLNPIKHLDLFGSIILPVILYFTHAGFILGWAKPVPYNSYNLRPGRWSEALVAIAGPASNLILAIIFGMLLRFGVANGFSVGFLQITSLIVFMNLLLMVFNLVPIPPLDGSKVLFAVFPESTFKLRGFFERYGFILVIFFIFFLWQFISPLITVLFTLITGVSL